MAGRALDHPLVAWSLIVAPALAVDAALIATGHDSGSEHAGRHLAVTGAVLALLGCHFAGRPRALARFDPLAACGRLIANTR